MDNVLALIGVVLVLVAVAGLTMSVWWPMLVAGGVCVTAARASWGSGGDG